MLLVPELLALAFLISFSVGMAAATMLCCVMISSDSFTWRQEQPQVDSRLEHKNNVRARAVTCVSSIYHLHHPDEHDARLQRGG